MSIKTIPVSLVRRLPLKAVTQESLLFFLKLGYWPNLKTPRSFNEKINQKKLIPCPMVSLCSDKLAVRDFIAKKFGHDLLIPLLFEGPSITEKELLSLGDHIVVKTNHDSGSVFPIKTNSPEVAKKIVTKLKSALKNDFGSQTNQPAYSLITPKILVEKRLYQSDQGPPDDYKLFCFKQTDDSIKYYITVHRDRDTPSYRHSFYDSELAPIALKGFTTEAFPDPETWPKMKTVAEQVTREFDFVRLDLYNVDGKLYFGEMTFFPSGGRWEYTRQNGVRNDFDFELGDAWVMPTSSNKSA